MHLQVSCPEGKYQTCAVITIVGDLRDKDARTNNLLKITGLENRIVSLNAPHQFTLIPIEKWSVVDKNIAEYSSFSREWLSKEIM